MGGDKELEIMQGVYYHINMEVRKKKKETTLNDLALMVGKGFADVDKRFEQVDKRFEQVDKRFEQVDGRFGKVGGRLDRIDNTLAHVDARLDRIEKDIQEINSLLVTRDEFDDLMARVKYMEMKLGIESGK